MSIDLYAWLDEAITRREETARAAATLCGCHPQAPSWTFTDSDDDGRIRVVDDPHTKQKRKINRRWNYTMDGLRMAEHIVLNDPAAVLRRCAADRKILEELAPDPAAEPESDEQLHARFAHPAYEYRTTTGQRKAWPDCGVPPYDEDGEPDTTWEPNIAAGNDGWERFDYTEECYWRRRLPPGQERQPYVDPVIRYLADGYGRSSD